MVVALQDPERDPVAVLLRDEPRLEDAAAIVRALRLDSADAEALALSERVERQALALADHPALLVLDRAGLLADVAIEEFAERPLSDEADAGRILLLRVGQADLARDAAHFRLAQFADGEQRLRHLRLVQSMQEVALVLRFVEALE